MPTKSQSPGPNPTITSTASRKPRKKEHESGSEIVGRAGSAGGIVLSREQIKAKSEGKMSSAPAGKAATPPPGKDAVGGGVTTTTGPNRQRRRPRKLNREPASQQAPTGSSSTPTTRSNAAPSASSASTIELEALKSRVRGLEAKVEELYTSGGVTDSRNARSPRRRGKGRKGSSQQNPTISAAQATTVEDEEEADEELVRLEGELEVARQDLERARPRPRPKKTTSEETEYIEEIHRDGVGIEEMASTGDRQVTLTGNYRIPLPSTVSMANVKSIQGGVTAAQNVAKSFLEQRRAQQAVKPTPSTRPKAKQAASTAVTNNEGDGKSWGEWFGGYSMAISRAVKNIEADAAVESQKRPAQGRTTSAPVAKTTPAAKTTTRTQVAIAPKGEKRPPMKSRAGKDEAH